MFDTFNGLPLHPLIVHGVVVLLPLAIVGTVAIALRPAWRTRYGFLVVGAALAATAMIPVATSSGEALEKRVGDPGEHAELGDQLLWFAVALLLTSALLVFLQWRAERVAATSGDFTGDTMRDFTAVTGEHASGIRTLSRTPTHTTSRTTSRQLSTVAVLAVIAAVACGVQVYRVGDSGARAAWGDTPASSSGK
ncbi:DUF2231 domain-containing protein [Nocardioides zhouii]|uniref:DUF2231 domain-containing protein n=1 Tax=Nocardioides zhouii TaxID=1168729 RepID=A0A4Q2SFB6_9ACTN|nr:DUF2231 domain-containing protein [Nocardioides zhouii]RYC03802.1 hypothetical protein EUA94_21365 [Nocardioides zhouii]